MKDAEPFNAPSHHMINLLRIAYSNVPGHQPLDAHNSNGVKCRRLTPCAPYFSQGRTPITPRIFIYSGGGARVEAGEYSTNPIVFKIVNAATETPLVNAPVTVDIGSGTGKVSLTRGGPPTSSMVILSDAQGLVRAYFKAPREVRSHTSS